MGGTAKGFALTDTPVGMKPFTVHGRCALCTSVFCMLCFNASFFVRATTFHVHSGSYMLLSKKATKQGWGSNGTGQGNSNQANLVYGGNVPLGHLP